MSGVEFVARVLAAVGAGPVVGLPLALLLSGGDGTGGSVDDDLDPE